MAGSPRNYGLFFKNKAGKWVRLYAKLSYRKETAIRVFQNRLIDLSFRGKCPALRPVKVPVTV